MTTAQEVNISELIHPTPKQRQLLDAVWEGVRTNNPEYILYGGAAGPGKSYALRWSAAHVLLHLAVEYQLRNVRVGLFCETYPALRDRHIDVPGGFRHWPDWLGTWHDSDKNFVLHERYGSGVISLRNLDQPDKYASAEFAVIYVDELTYNTRETFELLRSRKRWAGVPNSPFVAATNPRQRGLFWVRKLWIEHDFSGDLDRQLAAARWLFIPALIGENPYVPASYLDTLRSLSPQLRSALLEGNWYIFEGQAFPEFAATRHVIPVMEINPHWRRIAGHDWGYESPGHHLWGAIDPQGGVIIYRELQFRHLDPKEIADVIQYHQGQDRVTVTWADPSIWAERRHSDLSMDQLEALEEAGKLVLSKALQYQAVGLHCEPANNARIAGKSRLHTLLREREDGIPLLRIMENCPILIRTLSNLQLDPDRVEDVITDYLPTDEVRDDAYDALRYLVMGVPDKATPERRLPIQPRYYEANPLLRVGR